MTYYFPCENVKIWYNMAKFGKEVAGIEKKHSEQIEALYFELFDRLMAYASSVLCSPSLAEEAVQETFRIACQKPQDVCDSPNPQGWIFNTLKFTICNIRNNQASAKHLLERYLLTQLNEITISEDRISIDVLYENVADSEEFQLLKELAVEQLSHEEMADKRGISVSACKKRVQRAKEKLQKKLKKSL